MTFLVNIVLKGGETGNEADVRLHDPSILPMVGDRVCVDGISGAVVSRTFHLTPFFTEVEILVSEDMEQ